MCSERSRPFVSERMNRFDKSVNLFWFVLVKFGGKSERFYRAFCLNLCLISTIFGQQKVQVFMVISCVLKFLLRLCFGPFSAGKTRTFERCKRCWAMRIWGWRFRFSWWSGDGVCFLKYAVEIWLQTFLQWQEPSIYNASGIYFLQYAN